MIPPQIMTDTISIQRLTGNGAYGPVFSVPEFVKASVEIGFKKVVDAMGHEIVSSASVILYPTANIGIGDLVEFDSHNYTVIDVQPIKLLSTIHHLEVYLQSTGITDGS